MKDTPSKEQIARDAAIKVSGDDRGAAYNAAHKIILAAIDKARLRLKNLKMLDDIHKVVIKHSGNQELADSLWCHLRADGGKGAIAPPSAQPQPSGSGRTTPRGERSETAEEKDAKFFRKADQFYSDLEGAASSEPPKDRLLPCPFCGGRADFGTDSEGGQFVQCAEPMCQASSKLIFPDKMDVKPLLLEAWNNRIGSEPPKEEHGLH
jgi:hypothetical protein